MRSVITYLGENILTFYAEDNLSRCVASGQRSPSAYFKFCRIYAASGTLEEKQQESANHLMENFQEEDNPHFTSFSFSIVFAFCFSRVLLVLVVYSTDWLHISCVHSRWIAAQLFRTFQLCNASWLSTMWLQLQGSARNTLDRIFWCWSSPFQSAVSIYAFEHLPEID